MMVKSKRDHDDIDMRFQQLREYVDAQFALLREEFTKGNPASDERLHQIELRLTWIGGFLKGAGLTAQLHDLDLSNRA